MSVKTPEPIYMIRRKGLNDFVTRPVESFYETQAMPKMFETKIVWDATQAEAYAQAVRDEALEEAAKMVDNCHPKASHKGIAAAIRALKEQS